MGREFETLGEGIFHALLEDDVKKRREVAKAWQDSVLPILHKALPDVVTDFVETALGNYKETPDAFRRERISNILTREACNLVLEVKVVRKEREAPRQRAAAGALTPEQEWSGGEGARGYGGRPPSDDRSDSMNPNNAAHEAAVDNRANQMNPNNPAYHSSRGG
ncbi:MAG: hypothetical protein HY261_02945 [Chloroflexi bacterium]|nr:hypothetical protein [Chloroflexota bacterium]